LRIAAPPWGHLEQAIVTSRGWQTQLFLTQVAEGQPEFGDNPRCGLGPAATSVLQAKIGSGFDAHSSGPWLADIARIGLTNHRAIVPASDLLRMISEEPVDPMLGIYGAHALLRGGALEEAQLAVVIDRLRSLLGLHPDVEALARRLHQPSPAYFFDCPPMLANSWSLVLEAAARRPDLVPLGSLSERVSPHLWGGGPWLLWLVDEVPGTSPPSPALDLSDAVTRIAVTAAQLQADERAAFCDVELTDTEEALLIRASRMAGTMPAELDPQPNRQSAAYEPLSLVNALGIPPTAIQSVTASLLSKLQRAALATAKQTWQLIQTAEPNEQRNAITDRRIAAKVRQKIEELAWEPQYHERVSQYGTDYTFHKSQKRDPLKQVLRSYFPMQEEKDHRVYGAQDGAIRGNMFRQVQERWLEWQKLFLSIIPMRKSRPRGPCRCCTRPCRTRSCTTARRSR
jgi:hypothetical protein